MHSSISSRRITGPGSCREGGPREHLPPARLPKSPREPGPGVSVLRTDLPTVLHLRPGFGLNGIVPPFDIGNGKFVSYSLFLAAGAVTLTVINGGTNAGTQLWFDRKNGMFEQILM